MIAMKEIERLAKQFRNAIDAAFENGELRRCYPFSNFPYDCCEHTCDLLGQYLLENGIETFQMNGTCKKDVSWHHVWLLTNDDIVIDITGDQFIDKLVSDKDVEAVHVGNEGTIHKIFILNRIPQANTTFTDENEFTGFDKHPSVRQARLLEVYEIVRQYL